MYLQAYESYQGQNFKKASELFAKYTKVAKKASAMEGAAVMMQKRCQFYLQNPPSSEWDGVWDQA